MEKEALHYCECFFFLRVPLHTAQFPIFSEQPRAHPPPACWRVPRRNPGTGAPGHPEAATGCGYRAL